MIYNASNYFKNDRNVIIKQKNPAKMLGFFRLLLFDLFNKIKM